MKLTKQGVRDLSHLKVPRGLKLDLPPPEALICAHRAIIKSEDGKECRVCGMFWPAKI
jgi:hypothetical protein